MIGTLLLLPGAFGWFFGTILSKLGNSAGPYLVIVGCPLTIMGAVLTIAGV